MDRTHDGKAFRMLTVIDEFTRESLAIVVNRKLKFDDVLHYIADLFVKRGAPEHIRSENGAEFTASAVREWLGRIGVKTLLDGEAEALTRKAIELAKDGDITALRLCMDRILPVRKERPITIALP